MEQFHLNLKGEIVDDLTKMFLSILKMFKKTTYSAMILKLVK